jgi:hypothetical protein
MKELKKIELGCYKFCMRVLAPREPTNKITRAVECEVLQSKFLAS